MNRLEKVSLVQAIDIDKAVRDSIELIGGLQLNPDESVVIKPNICNSMNPNGIVLTDFRVIKAIVDLIHDNGNELIVVESDNISGTAEVRMKKSGLMNMLDSWGVDFLNISHDDYHAFEIANTVLKIPRTILDAGYFINIPKIKTCAHTLVTLGIKNLYGVIQRKQKGKLHKHLNTILPFLAETIRNDLVIVDGINCMEGNGPIIGNQVSMNLILAGRNLIPVDAVCCWLMGYDPTTIPHIAKSAAMDFGPIDPSFIDVVGEDWRNYVKIFEPPFSLKAMVKSLKGIKDIYLT